MMLSILHSIFAMPKHTNVISWLAGNSCEMVIYAFCKVEFIQSFFWLYSVPNLLVIQHLEILYLGGNHVRVVCERVWRKAQNCALKKSLATGSRNWQLAKGDTHMKHAGELKSHTSWITTGLKVQIVCKTPMKV